MNDLKLLLCSSAKTLGASAMSKVDPMVAIRYE
jgi:hypothetical protein